MRPVPSSGEGTKALINAATISSCPLYMISCAVLLHFSKKEKKINKEYAEGYFGKIKA